MGAKLLQPFEVTQRSTLTAEQEDVLGQLMGQLQAQIGQGVAPFPGQITPEASQLQRQGFDLAGQIPGQIGGLQNIAMQGLQRTMQPFDPATAMQTMEPARQLGLRTFERDIIPMLSEKFLAGTGARGSGSFARELSRGGQDLSLGLSAQLAPYLFAGEQAQRQRETMIPGMAGQAAGIPGIGLQALMGAGGQQRGIQSEQGQEAFQKWAMSQPTANPWLDFLGKGLGTQAFENIVQPAIRSQSQSGGGGGLMSSLLPALGMAAGGFLAGPALAGMMGGGAGASTAATGFSSGWPVFGSDLRIKENITTIDNSLNKVKTLTGKSYNFITKSASDKDAGIIAQDLEKVLPEAVVEIGGIKYVKYEAIIALLVNAVKELAVKVEGS